MMRMKKYARPIRMRVTDVYLGAKTIRAIYFNERLIVLHPFEALKMENDLRF